MDYRLRDTDNISLAFALPAVAANCLASLGAAGGGMSVGRGGKWGGGAISPSVNPQDE